MELLHKLLVYGGLGGRGVLVLLANFTIRFCKGLLTMLSSLRWHEKAGEEKEDE